MKKILILANDSVYVYNLRRELIERFISEGHKVFIASEGGESVSDLENMGCVHYEIKVSRHGMNPADDLALLGKYKKIIREIGPEVVLTYNIKPNIYGAVACKSLKVPCIANITGLGTAVENKSVVQSIIVLMYRYAFTDIKKVFFQNSENMQFFADRKIAPGKYDLLPGSGVNLQRFVPLEYLSSEKTEFVFIARIMKEKGIDQYLEAAEYIRRKYPDTVFHVCGFCEQAYEEKLKELGDKGVIVYHGMVKDIKTILRDVHCTVHPTYYPEGMSNVLLESCASARPIITTDRSGCREIVDDGINGYVCRQKDGADLIEKIERFLALPFEEKRKMGENGRRKVEREFDREIVVKKYLEAIERFE